MSVNVSDIYFWSFCFFSCEEDTIDNDLNSLDEITLTESEEFDGSGLKSTAQEIDYCGEKLVTTLYAARHINGGTIETSNDEDYLYVTITTKDVWHLKHTHVYVGLLENSPLSRPGNPQVGRFPHQTAHISYVTSYPYLV